MDINMIGEQNLTDILQALQEEIKNIGPFPDYVGVLDESTKLNLEQALTAVKYEVPIGYIGDNIYYAGPRRDDYAFHELKNTNDISKRASSLSAGKRDMKVFLNPHIPDRKKTMQILNNLIAYDKQLYIKDNGNEIGLKERNSLIKKLEETRHFTEEDSFKNNDLKVKYGDGFEGTLTYDYDRYLFVHDIRDTGFEGNYFVPQDRTIKFSTTVDAAEYLMKTIKPEMVRNIVDNDGLYFNKMYLAEKYVDVVKNLTMSEDSTGATSLDPSKDGITVRYGNEYAGFLYYDKDKKYCFLFDEKDLSEWRILKSNNVLIKFDLPETAAVYLANEVLPSSVVRVKDEMALEKCVGPNIVSDFTFERSFSQGKTELLAFKNKFLEDELCIDREGDIYQNEGGSNRYEKLPKRTADLVVSEYLYQNGADREEREFGSVPEDPDSQVTPEMILRHYQMEKEALLDPETLNEIKEMEINSTGILSKELLNEKSIELSQELIGRIESIKNIENNKPDDLIVRYGDGIEPFKGVLLYNSAEKFCFAHDMRDERYALYDVSPHTRKEFRSAGLAAGYLVGELKPYSVVLAKDEECLEKCVGRNMLKDFSFESATVQNDIALIAFKNRFSGEKLLIDREGAVYECGLGGETYTRVSPQEAELIVGKHALARAERQDRSVSVEQKNYPGIDPSKENDKRHNLSLGDYRAADAECLKRVDSEQIKQLAGSHDVRDLRDFFKIKYGEKLISLDQYMEFNKIATALVETRKKMNQVTPEKVNEFTGKVEEKLDSLLYLKARNVSLETYCKNAGYVLQKAGGYMKVAGLPGAENDMVLIKGNSFTAKDGELSGDTVSFVRRYENKSKNEAILDVLAAGKDIARTRDFGKDMALPRAQPAMTK